MRSFLLSIVCIGTLFSFSGCQKELNGENSATTTLVLQPGSPYGLDALVASLPIYAPYNLTANPDIAASAWTYFAQGYDSGTVRTYINFAGMDNLPYGNISIDSATLFLYGLNPFTGTASPEGNSVYLSSPYNSFGNNNCWLKRVVGSWSQDNITWENKPNTTDQDETAVPASTSQWNSDVAVDITQLMRDIAASKQNFGLCLELQNETYYRSLNFAGGRYADSTKWPKIIITYTLH